MIGIENGIDKKVIIFMPSVLRFLMEKGRLYKTSKCCALFRK